MLHPDWLIENLDDVTELYNDFHTDLLKSIAKHFIETTGYGLVDGLHGANCRHSYSPYYPGISTPRLRAV